jgi:hypothetical protein
MFARRFVLVATLLVAVGAVSLVGCSQLPTNMIPPESAGQSVAGVPVSHSSLRLYAGTNRGQLAYEIERGRVYEGSSNQGQAVLFYENDRIYRGSNPTGEILFRRKGDRLFVGANAAGAIAYTVENGRIHEGTAQGPIAYRVERDRMFAGANASGPIVFEANRSLTDDDAFLLAVLADRRY